MSKFSATCISWREQVTFGRDDDDDDDDDDDVCFEPLDENAYLDFYCETIVCW